MSKIISFLLVFFSVSFYSYSQDNTHALTVSIAGLQKNKGKVFVAVYNSEASFLNNNMMTKSATVVVSNNSAEITFKNLKKGEYAVSVFHDENDNNKLDTKIFGIPKEPYGFSNKAKGFMGPPEFSDAKFMLSESKKITITVK